MNLLSRIRRLFILIIIRLTRIPLYLENLGETSIWSWSWAITLLSYIRVIFVTYTGAQSFGQRHKNWNSLIIAGLLTRLLICFNSDNMLVFYVFFELRALIIFLIVLRLGYQPERLEARLYLLLFTVFTSLPFFALILYLGERRGITVFLRARLAPLRGLSEINRVVSVILVLGFLTKFPMYFVHIWLPKAHVEASTTGSILLAGILLKLGRFGLFRVICLLRVTPLINYISFFALLGGALISIFCVRITDLKILVAYSSVAHMSLVLRGILTITQLGQLGGLRIRVAHGVTSSALFFGVGTFYSWSNSRLYLLNSGYFIWAPRFAFFWFIFCCRNMGTPPAFNFWSELILIFSIVGNEVLTLGVLAIALFFAVAFNIIIYIRSQRQKEVSQLTYSLNFNLKEQRIFLLHLVWLLRLTFFFDIFFKYGENTF